MGRCAGLHPDQAARLFGKPRQHLRAPQRATNHQGAGLIDPMHLKDVFGDIHTDRANLFHGWLPLSWSLPTQLWHSDAVRGPSTPSFRDAIWAGPEPMNTDLTQVSQAGVHRFRARGRRPRPGMTN